MRIFQTCEIAAALYLVTFTPRVAAQGTLADYQLSLRDSRRKLKCLGDSVSGCHHLDR